jgi:hypothetical protein
MLYGVGKYLFYIGIFFSFRLFNTGYSPVNCVVAIGTCTTRASRVKTIKNLTLPTRFVNILIFLLKHYECAWYTMVMIMNLLTKKWA